MTHAELVGVAEKWLKRQGYQLVITRSSIMCSENPDALGFKASAFTRMVECKVSRSDFRADAKKWHRKDVGVGNERYFLVPEGLITAEEVPAGWGLLYATARGVKVIKKAESRPDRKWIEEMRHLIASIRRGDHKEEPEPFTWACA